MILSKSDSRYSAVRPSVAATAFIRSTSKPTILPLGSLNSFGAYGGLVPTISLPEDLMFSGTVLAISSTFAADGAAAVVDGPLPSVLLAHPDITSAPVAAKTAAMRHIFLPGTSCLFFLQLGLNGWPVTEH